MKKILALAAALFLGMLALAGPAAATGLHSLLAGLSMVQKSECILERS